jgi:hypothetical protein
MENIPNLYMAGMSIPEISAETGVPKSTVRLEIIRSGAKLRTRLEGIILASKNGRLGSGHRGKTRKFSESHKTGISTARKKWANDNAKGVSLKPDGYLEYTRGPHKGRLVHVVEMENVIGRRIKKGECVHHIDECKTNNHISNLALMTVAAHSRLHRHLDAMRKEARERDKNGRLS